MSNVLMKIRSQHGNLMVFDVQPQHVGQPEHILAYGSHRYSRLGGAPWMRVRGGITVGAASPEEVATLDAMALDFNLCPVQHWGMQVMVYRWDSVAQKQLLVWEWVRPTDGEPYRYDNEAQAYDMLHMCYPDTTRDRVRVHPFD